MGLCGGGTCDDGGACNPFTLTVAPGSLRKDGQSSALVVSSPIRRGNGDPIPNGTQFTVRVVGAEVATVDQDLDREGIQVISHGGMIDFGIRAAEHVPGQELGQVQLSAEHTRAERCAGATTAAYVDQNAHPHRAMDFSSFDATDMRSVIVPEARTTVLPGFPTAFGDALDGDWSRSDDQNYYRLHSLMRNAAVTAIGERSATAAGSISNLSRGDEVLLINLQGSPVAHDNVGVYEFFRIAAVDRETLTYTFDRPVTKVFGAARTNLDLTGQKIMLQRVPNFGSVSGGIYGDNHYFRWNGVTGGVLAFRARRLDGSITFSSVGYRRPRPNDDIYVGESYAGEATPNSYASNFGAGPASRYQCTQNYLYNCHGGAGHRSVGPAIGGRNDGGAEYGDPDLRRLLMGSGPSYMGWMPSASGGGIVAVFAEQVHNTAINVSGSNSIPGNSGFASGGSSLLVADTITGNLGFTPEQLLARARVDARSIEPPVPAWVYRGRTGDGSFNSTRLNTGETRVARAKVLSAPNSRLGGEFVIELTNSSRDNEGERIWHRVAVGEWVEFPQNQTGSDLRMRITFSSLSRDPLAVNGVSVQWQHD